MCVKKTEKKNSTKKKRQVEKFMSLNVLFTLHQVPGKIWGRFFNPERIYIKNLSGASREIGDTLKK